MLSLFNIFPNKLLHDLYIVVDDVLFLYYILLHGSYIYLLLSMMLSLLFVEWNDMMIFTNFRTSIRLHRMRYRYHVQVLYLFVLFFRTMMKHAFNFGRQKEQRLILYSDVKFLVEKEFNFKLVIKPMV